MSLSRFFHPIQKRSCKEEESSSADDNVIEILDSDSEEETCKGSKPILSKEKDPNLNEEKNGVQEVPGNKYPKIIVSEAGIHLGPCDEPTNPNATLLEDTLGKDAETSETKNKAVEITALLDSSTTEGSASSAAAPTIRTNPFAKFAFQQGKASSSPFALPKKVSNSFASLPTTRVAPPAKKAKTSKKDWIRMRDIPNEEQDRIVTKWHSFVLENTDLEDARFQILVAARLHARCQEGPVQQAMKALRQKLGESSFSANRMADTDPEELHEAIRNLQYYPTKAKHVVKAAQEIRSQFQGMVPEQEAELRQLTGIGPVMGDLLAFVNTRKVHRQRRQSVNEVDGVSSKS